MGRTTVQEHNIEKAVVEASQTPLDFPRDIHGTRWILVVISLISVTFLWGLDGTIVADIQATFVRDFGAIDKLAYNGVAFFLGAAVFVLSWSQIYGQFDVKYAFIVSILLFEVGSLLCGVAPNEDCLIAGRALCGVGGSGMYTGVLTMLSIYTTEKERPLYMACPGITWGIGTVLGPVIGGAFAESRATWRWGFYINLCVGGLFAPVYLFLVPSKPSRPGRSFITKIGHIDLVGLALLTLATTTLLLGINFGGVLFPWNSGAIVALFTIAAATTLGFAVQQYAQCWVQEPLFPVGMFVRLDVLLVVLNETCASTACFLPCYFIPLFFQYVHNESPLMAGVRLLPFICFMVATVMLCGKVVSATGNWLPWFFYGGAMVVVGSALMFNANERASAAAVYGYSILIGTGAGAYIQMPFNVVQELVDPSKIPAAVGLVTWAQLVAPAITLSISNTVFLNRAKIAVGQILPPEAPVLDVVSGSARQYLEQLQGQERALVIHAIVKTMSYSYLLVLISGGLTLASTTTLMISTRNNLQALAPRAICTKVGHLRSRAINARSQAVQPA